MVEFGISADFISKISVEGRIFWKFLIAFIVIIILSYPKDISITRVQRSILQGLSAKK